MCGYPPWDGDDLDKCYRQIKKLKYEFHDDAWHKVSEEAKDLVKNLLTLEEGRMGAKEILRHPWIKKLSKTRVVKQMRTRVIE